MISRRPRWSVKECRRDDPPGIIRLDLSRYVNDQAIANGELLLADDFAAENESPGVFAVGL